MALLRILVVDNQPEDLQLLEQVADNLDLEIVRATSGADVLRLLRDHEFNLLLIDADSPEEDGRRLAEEILGNGVAKNLPILLLAEKSQDQRLENFQKGCVDVLQRPLDAVLLRSKVRILGELQEQKLVIRRQLAALEHQKYATVNAVAERQYAEQALRESEARYRTLVEMSPVAIVVQVAQEICYVNSAMLHLLGAPSSEDMLGRSLLEFFHPNSREAGRQFMDRTLRRGGRLAPVEATFLRGDGAEVHVEIAGASIMYGGKAGAQFAILDITNRKHIEDELRNLTRKDELTQVGNRRAFDEVLDRETRRAQRAKHALALLMIDIDAFKPYNDNFGHQAGDEALQRVAGALQQVVQRPADCVARYGGEEFSVILPETSLHGARKVAEELRRTVQDLGIPHAHSPVAPVITVSIGGAQAQPESGLEPGRLLEAADFCLYKAKDAGRNQVKMKRI